MQLVRRPVNVQGAQRRVTHHVQGLIIGGNQDIDVRPFIRIVRQCYGRASQRPDGLKITQKEDEECVTLSEDQADNEERIEHSPMVGRILKELDCPRNAPISIAKSTEQRHDHQRQGDQVRVGTARHRQGNQERQQSAHCLLRPSEREYRQKTEDSSRTREEEQAKQLGKCGCSGANIQPEACWRHRSLQRTPR